MLPQKQSHWRSVTTRNVGVQQSRYLIHHIPLTKQRMQHNNYTKRHSRNSTVPSEIEAKQRIVGVIIGSMYSKMAVQTIAYITVLEGRKANGHQLSRLLHSVTANIRVHELTKTLIGLKILKWDVSKWLQ